MLVEGRDDEIDDFDDDDVEGAEGPSPLTPFARLLIKSILEAVYENCFFILNKILCKRKFASVA